MTQLAYQQLAAALANDQLPPVSWSSEMLGLLSFSEIRYQIVLEEGWLGID